MKAFKTAEGKQAVIAQYKAMIKEAGVSHEEMYVNTGYGETFLLATGDKDKAPVILLHGSSMNSLMWAKDMERLRKDYRVYAPDLPGEPGRSDEEQLPLDTMDYANWLGEVLDALGIDTVSLVGISLGGWLAAKFAIAHPSRVSKLVLLCPAGIGGQNEAFKDIALSLLSQGEAGADELLRRINGGNTLPERMLGYQKLIASVFNGRQEPIPMFTDEELRRLTMPCLLMVGAKDIMLHSAQTAQRMEAQVPGAKIVLLPEAGHSLTGKAEDIALFLKEQ